MLAGVILLIGGYASIAAAQTPEDVTEAYQNASFETAIELAKKIETTGSISKEAYLSLLETKLLAQAALQDAAAVDETLRALIELDRARAFGPGIPPDLQARFKTLRTQTVGEPAISIVTRRERRDLLVSAELVGDSAQLFRHFELAVGSGGAFREIRAWPARLEGMAEQSTSVRVRAIGPAGIAITEASREYKPATSPIARSLAAPLAGPSEEEGDDSLTWWILGAVAVVAVAGIATTAIVLSQEPDTRVSAPTLSGP